MLAAGNSVEMLRQKDERLAYTHVKHIIMISIIIIINPTSDFFKIFSKYTPARPEQQHAARVAANPTVILTFG